MTFSQAPEWHAVERHYIVVLGATKLQTGLAHISSTASRQETSLHGGLAQDTAGQVVGF